MQYYHDLVTKKSWEELTGLSKQVKFVLIGGWATYLYSGALKSKDIDIVVDYDQLPVIEKLYPLFKNERLHKYEAVKEEVQIDIYLPHFSQIGIPAEDILKQSKSLEGFNVIDINLLFVSKIYTLSQRGRTPKGRKDFLDIISLFISRKCDLKLIRGFIDNYHLSNARDLLVELLKEATQVLELNLNPHQFSKIKKELVSQIK
ncbi:MAG: Uncharacterized protein FD145_967 [Candidatus Saganbacteria bacterium]|uniref:Nucleotidyltransferase family protein n=1 Tax=Candidatus Saganbacteria bacterium TaxID=2575572 RepID=A0A833L111_UNCSA|nr:MAG: Uncharacterized protein FD145_967 [Candidatus Saganbacteria bacterium]